MFTNPVLRMEFNVDIPLNEQLTRYLDAVFEHIWRSPSQFSTLVPTIPPPPPVPFLGRVDTARVLTLGVNPCAGDIELGHFPDRGGSSAMAGLLLGYFGTGRPGPDGTNLSHGLATWECVLNRLGISYTDGTAAHLFLSPRAVHALDTRDHYLFREMCRYDAPMVLRLL